MSYAFNVRAATAILALAAVTVEMDKVLANQACQPAEKDKAVAAVGSFLELLPAGAEGEELAVSVSGYLAVGSSNAEIKSVSHVGLNVEATWVQSEVLPDEQAEVPA